MVVILGSGDSGKNYRNATEMLTDPINQVDPTAAAVGDHLVVFEVADGQAVILAQGSKKSCDGGVLVLGLIPDEYELIAGVPILGTGGTEDVEPSDQQEQVVTLEGRRVANGSAYKAWLKRRSGENF